MGKGITSGKIYIPSMIDVRKSLTEGAKNLSGKEYVGRIFINLSPNIKTLFRQIQTLFEQGTWINSAKVLEKILRKTTKLKRAASSGDLGIDDKMLIRSGMREMRKICNILKERSGTAYEAKIDIIDQDFKDLEKSIVKKIKIPYVFNQIQKKKDTVSQVKNPIPASTIEIKNILQEIVKETAPVPSIDSEEKTTESLQNQKHLIIDKLINGSEEQVKTYERLIDIFNQELEAEQQLLEQENIDIDKSKTINETILARDLFVNQVKNETKLLKELKNLLLTTKTKTSTGLVEKNQPLHPLKKRKHDIFLKKLQEMISLFNENIAKDEQLLEEYQDVEKSVLDKMLARIDKRNTLQHIAIEEEERFNLLQNL